MKRRTKLILALTVSALLLAVLVQLVGARQTFDAVTQAGLPAVLSVGVMTAIWLVLQAAAWAALNRTVGHRVKFRSLLAASTVGLAGNMLTPSTYLGGEPGRVLYIGRRTRLPYEQLIGTVLLMKYVEAMSFLLFVAAGTAVALAGMSNVLLAGPAIGIGIAMIVAASVALCLTAVIWISLARRWRPLTRLIGWVAKLGLFRRFLARLRVRLRRVEDQASSVFGRERKMVTPAFFLLLATHVTIYFKPFLFMWIGYGTVLHAGEMGLIFLSMQILLAFQLTPSGVGTLDGGLIGVLAISGIAITRPQCLAFLLCLRLWDAIILTTGATLAARVGLGLFSANKDKPAATGT